jgi:hypothetical protein
LLFGRIGTRRCIEQCKLGNALRRLPHHRKGDVTAHRQTGERKTLRRSLEDPRRDCRHGVVTGVVGDSDRPVWRQRRHLSGVQTRAAQQPGHKNER